MANNTTRDALVRRRAVWNIASNYVAQFVTIGIGFVMTPLIIHQLGATVYGLWVLVGSVASYGLLLDLGIASAVTKYVAEYRAKQQADTLQQLVSTALCMYLVLGLAVIVLSALLASPFPSLFHIPAENRSTATWLVVLSGLSVGVAIPCSIPTAILRGLQRFDLLNIIGVSGTLVSAVATVAVLLLGGGALGMIMVTIGTTLVMQIPSIWLIRRVVPELRLTLSGARRQSMRTVATFSASLFVTQIAGQLSYKTDEIVIGAYLPVATVTPYAVARRLSEVPQLMARQVIKIVLPLASELHAGNDQARLQTLYIVSTRTAMASFLCVGCSLVVLARPVMEVWVGTTYAGSALIVLVLTFASCVDIGQWPAVSILQGKAMHRPIAIVSICSGVANLVLSVALLPRYGVLGVALGTLIANVIESLIFVLPYTMRAIGVSPKDTLQTIFLPVLLPVVPTVAVLYMMQQIIPPASLFTVAFVGGSGVLVYVLVYLWQGAGTLERKMVAGIVRRMYRTTKGYIARS